MGTGFRSQRSEVRARIDDCLPAIALAVTKYAKFKSLYSGEATKRRRALSMARDGGQGEAIPSITNQQSQIINPERSEIGGQRSKVKTLNNKLKLKPYSIQTL